MKKGFNYFLKIGLVLVFVLPYLTIPSIVSAKTLSDLKKELETKQTDLVKTQEQTALTEQQISQINSNIKNIEASISQTYKDIDTLNNEISNLNNQIAEKDAEMKELVSYVQTSSGTSSYLEYIFGAKDFTDFIYRIAVAEQLSSYNDKLIDQYNSMIEANKQKQKEIESKRVELTSKQQELASEKSKLGQDLENLTSTSIDIADDIKAQKEIIKFYADLGCKDSENISVCGRKVLPAGTAFYRPLQSGYVTSEWGTRGSGWHEGIDVSNATYGVNVFSVATGKVVYIYNQYSCGGNMVIMHHKINGQSYTTVYAHLRSINVSVGDVVDKNTVIGTMGGGSDTTSYDKCTFGQHLHLTVARGLYGIDYQSWSSMNYTYSINPRTVINFPAGLRNSWTDRLTAF